MLEITKREVDEMPTFAGSIPTPGYFFIMLCDWCLQIKCRSRVFMVYFEKEHANGNIEITRKLRRRMRIKRRTTTILKPTRTPRKIRTTNKKNKRNNEKNKNKNKTSIASIIYSLKQRQKVSTRNSDIFMHRRLRLSCKISLHVASVCLRPYDLFP